jgi:LPS sulfotransferase NodH
MQYQTRDLGFNDYKMGGTQLPSGDYLYFRDMPDGLNLNTIQEDSFSIIGPAFSLGCHCNQTFGKLLEIETGLKQYNFSLQGSSAETYLREEFDELIQAINKTKFCIVVGFSGRSVSNSEFKHSNELVSSEKLRKINENKLFPAHKLYEEVLNDKGESALNDLITETQKNYLRCTEELIKKIKTKTIFLWFSKRSPSQFKVEKTGQKDIFLKMGKFPHFVDQKMVDKLKGIFDYYVDSTESIGTPQLLFSRMTGEVAAVKKDKAYGYSSSEYNRYYASPLMQYNAYQSLLPTVERLKVSLNRSYIKDISSRKFKTVSRVFNELHFAKFMRLNKKLRVFIDDFYLNAMQDHYIDSKENVALFHPLSSNLVTTSNHQELTSSFDFSLSLRKGIECNNSDAFAYMASKSLPFHEYLRNSTKTSNPEVIEKFVILTSPRSGSTMLGAMLTNGGFGNVIEHFRTGVFNLLDDDSLFNIDFKAFTESLIIYGSKKNRVLGGQYFGTKIISHFLRDSKSEGQFFNFFTTKNTKFIRLIREDKTAQVSSILMARYVKVWHQKIGEKLKFDEDFIVGKLNDDEVLNVYTDIRDQEEYLDLMESKFGISSLNVSYENLIDKSKNELQSVFNFLVPGLELSSYNELIKLSVPNTSKIATDRAVSPLYAYVNKVITKSL